jgi:hypothetical protein
VYNGNEYHHVRGGAVEEGIPGGFGRYGSVCAVGYPARMCGKSRGRYRVDTGRVGS